MYEVLKASVQPYLVVLLAQGLILVWMFRRKLAPRRVTLSLFSLWVLMVILSLPIVARLLMVTLEWYPPLYELPRKVDAIVVMGGGLVPPDAYRAQAQVSGSSYTRCIHAARLYQTYRCAAILCGGATEEEDTDVSEAEVMADAMEFLGVDRQHTILEPTSQSTRQNVIGATKIIRQRGFQNVMVVTHARHMRRADLCFRKLGADVILAPCSAESARLLGPVDETWIPQSSSMSASSWVFKEWVALLYYRLRGWI